MGEADPINVLHVIGGLTLNGGANTFVTGLARQPIPGVSQAIWVHRDFDPSVERYPLVRWGRARRVAGTLGGDLRAALLDVLPLASWVRKQRRPVLHAHSRAGILAGAILNRLTRVPLVVHLHARSSRTALYRRLWTAEKVVPVFNSRVTCEHFGANPANALIVVPPIAWPESVRPQAGGVPRFVMASAFIRLKNLDWACEAFHRLTREGTQAALVIFGLSRNPHDPVYQQEMIEAAAGNPRITLCEYDPAWLEKLSAEDIFIHTAVIEAFGIVILEAFAHGCRIIVPQGTFLDDLPAPVNANGIFRLESPSADGVYRKMKESLLGSVSREELHGQRKVVQRLFSHEASVAILGPLYRSLAADTDEISRLPTASR